MPTIELNTDVALGVAIPSRDARGRIARLGPVVDSILASHAYPPAIEQLLAEALTLTALLGSLLKEPQGQLTLQAQTEGGIVDLMVCDYLGGELRGYVRHDGERLAEASAEPTLEELFGQGYLAITFDQPLASERYQGIVPLEGKNLGEAAQSYFAQSEQIPSLVRLAAEKGGGHWSAGGLLLQHLPEDEVRTLAAIPLRRGCRCDPAYVRSVIARFPADEREAMVGDDGLIRVDCAFCSSTFAIEPKELSS